MYFWPFHYPEDHGGVKPKELSPFVGPKSNISEKLDQNWSCLWKKLFPSAEHSQTDKFGSFQAKQAETWFSINQQFWSNFSEILDLELQMVTIL